MTIFKFSNTCNISLSHLPNCKLFSQFTWSLYIVLTNRWRWLSWKMLSNVSPSGDTPYCLKVNILDNLSAWYSVNMTNTSRAKFINLHQSQLSSTCAAGILYFYESIKLPGRISATWYRYGGGNHANMMEKSVLLTLKFIWWIAAYV